MPCYEKVVTVDLGHVRLEKKAIQGVPYAFELSSIAPRGTGATDRQAFDFGLHRNTVLALPAPQARPPGHLIILHYHPLYALPASQDMREWIGAIEASAKLARGAAADDAAPSP